MYQVVTQCPFETLPTVHGISIELHECTTMTTTTCSTIIMLFYRINYDLSYYLLPHGRTVHQIDILVIPTQHMCS